MTPRWILGWAALAAAACTPSVQGKDLCASDQECVAGYRCMNGHCTRGDSRPDGAGDARSGVLTDFCSAGVAETADGAVPSLCAGSKMPLCEGFDQSGLSALWEPVTSNGRVSVDGFSCRGAGALKAQGLGTDDPSAEVQAEDSEESLLPVNPELFVRTFVYLPAPIPTRVFRLLGLLENGGAYNGTSLWVSGGFLELDLADGQNYVQKAPLPADRWLCLELRFRPDATRGEVQVWVDETEVQELRLTGDTALPDGADYGRLSVGLFVPGGGPTAAYTVWIDELALDRARIHCDR